MMLRRYLSSAAAASSHAAIAHRMVQQRVQGQLSLLSKPVAGAAAPSQTRVVFVAKPATPDVATLQAALPFPVSAAALRDFQAKPQENMYLYPSVDNVEFAQQRVLLVGLGSADQVTATVLRDATHGALSMVKAKRAKDVVFEVPTLEGCKLDATRVVELLSQASMLSNYQFDQYLSPTKDAYGDDKLRLPLEQIYLDVAAEFQKNVTEQVTVGEETIFARNLGAYLLSRRVCTLLLCADGIISCVSDAGNERSHIVNPAFMEEVARASADLPNMSIRVLQQEQLEQEGMNMFLSVGQAATCPPRLVILEYLGNPDSEEKVALVGKGITFDTGGLNLKPTGAIEDMHTDMCGSAAVLGAIRAASRQGLKVNVVCALALAENAIGSKAVKPHTIVKSHKGITVENNNTDAEGRLVLGDALSYVQKEYSPKKIVDVATLTGACMGSSGVADLAVAVWMIT
ncbi:hypothetical protein BBJ28_00026247 [Nothophytophthora sp. Chile5]|nr:hypothetical protein BBJ28_00026247 [Nothophytophthora sp. Chile5]